MKGISLSRGKYIWIAEADDLAEPDFLETCINSTQQAEDVSICYTGSLLIDNTGQVLRKDVNHWGHRKAKANSCFNGVLFATHNYTGRTILSMQVLQSFHVKRPLHCLTLLSKICIIAVIGYFGLKWP